EPSRMNPGDVEQLVDEPIQVSALLNDCGDLACSRCTARSNRPVSAFWADAFGGEPQRSERRSELVRSHQNELVACRERVPELAGPLRNALFQLPVQGRKLKSEPSGLVQGTTARKRDRCHLHAEVEEHHAEDPMKPIVTGKEAYGERHDAGDC